MKNFILISMSLKRMEAQKEMSRIQGRMTSIEIAAQRHLEGINTYGGTYDYSFYTDGVNLTNGGESDFASTSSYQSKEYYKLIVESDSAPEELKTLIKKCL